MLNNDVKTALSEVVREALKPIQSQLNEHTETIKKMQAETIRGQGRLNAEGQKPAMPSKEDLAPYARAKLEATSLEDVCKAIAEASGKSIAEVVGKPKSR